ncbi:hypothetical protein CAI21_09800 [Alkalilimnicola ehrlichii]|uniref:Uncharacterized protein n=1 Tax=Alkalilimnicola ehrlichii TaxID=351052 RepID=A0A3E0WVM2_9GAMM|nr:hypothetical protein [Alkalilimnicola ehrlichii]RFA29354.1 hypothetical protein CAI21_09800 [Alkalilimnicola ehrlichii]RFA36868.1 hypothetical protein CAL65_10135 [Alkalilimnicola ehrlichii]
MTDFAGNIDLGIGGDSVNFAGKLNDGTTDYWLLNVAGSQGTATNYTTTYNTAGAAVDLFHWDSSTNELGSLIASGVETGAGGGGAVEFTLQAFLAAGSYVLRITGDQGTSYAGTVSAVPLPGAAILFASALFGAGVLGRRRLASQKLNAVAA